jgi:hypothetical protein
MGVEMPLAGDIQAGVAAYFIMTVATIQKHMQ